MNNEAIQYVRDYISQALKTLAQNEGSREELLRGKDFTLGSREAYWNIWNYLNHLEVNLNEEPEEKQEEFNLND